MDFASSLGAEWPLEMVGDWNSCAAVMNPDFQVIACSLAFRDWVHASGAFALRADFRLVPADGEFETAMRAALNAPSTRLVRLLHTRPEEKGGALFEIARIGGRQVSLVIVERFGEDIVLDIPLLEEAFTLTKAEGRVAQVAVNGSSAKQIGRVLDVSHETVRTHLKNLYRKTGAAGHTELIALLTSFR